MWTPLSSKYNLMNDFFKVMLGLEEPWSLTHVELEEKEKTWHLLIDFKPLFSNHFAGQKEYKKNGFFAV